MSFESSRLLRDTPEISRIRFVAYTNAEPRQFDVPMMGRRVHAQACRSRGDNIAGMICLESLRVFFGEQGPQFFGVLCFIDIPVELNSPRGESRA